MSMASEKQRHGDEDTMQIHISGHLVSLSFAKEPDTSAAQRVRSSLIDSFLRQDAAKHKPV